LALLLLSFDRGGDAMQETQRPREGTPASARAALLSLIALGVLSWGGCGFLAAYRFTFDGELHDQQGIAIAARPTYEGIGVRIQNKTTGTVRVAWDECAFVDVERQSHRVIHKGVRFSVRDQAQLPTLIPSAALIREVLVATDHVSYEEGGSGRQWLIRDHLPRGESARLAVGKAIALHLTLLGDDGRRIPVTLEMTIRWSGAPSLFDARSPFVVRRADQQHAYLQ
jgi:hypothetical protein